MCLIYSMLSGDMAATSAVDMASLATSEKLRFGVFDVDPSTGELRKAGVRIKIQEQPFQVLTALLEKPGELVTRDELRTRLWPDGAFVDYDHTLTTAVKKLRRALENMGFDEQDVRSVLTALFEFNNTTSQIAHRTRQAVRGIRDMLRMNAGL